MMQYEGTPAGHCPMREPANYESTNIEGLRRQVKWGDRFSKSPRGALPSRGRMR